MDQVTSDLRSSPPPSANSSSLVMSSNTVTPLILDRSSFKITKSKFLSAFSWFAMYCSSPEVSNTYFLQIKPMNTARPLKINQIPDWFLTHMNWFFKLTFWLGQALRSALHTINISLQNSFCESHTWRLVSWKALRELNALWALPVYPVFEEKSNGSEENWSSEKSH